MSERYSVLRHPSIGPIRGVNRLEGVTQFLGVQYATLAGRFARAELLKSYPSEHSRITDGIFDATHIGPIPISPAKGCEWEHKLIQGYLPSPEFEQSDVDCLTLNIAVPDVEPKDSSRWPVLALVHGGAFATGSSSYPQYDLGRIVQISVEMGQPMIAVGINYRLGVPGFLHSSAMKAAGYKPNNGLDDQRQGLLWIKEHIAGFHGDAERVTYIGESSGAASGCFHLHGTEPLFNQLIAMSGSSLVKAKPLEAAERSFKMAVQLLSSEDEGVPLSDAAQVDKLVNASMEDIREKIGRKFPLGPLVDGEMVPRTTTYAQLADPAATADLFPGRQWCKRVMTGDCQMDGNAYAPRVATRTDIFPQTLASHLSATLDPLNPSLTPAIITGYSLFPSTPTNTPGTTKSVLNLATDICFSLAARAFARAWSSTPDAAFLYRFNVPNPWTGPWKGHATHILDIAFLLQNYAAQLPSGQREAGERFARDVVVFVNGGVPWGAYKAGERESAMVYDAGLEEGEGDGSRWVEDEREGGSGRRGVLVELGGEEVLDRVMTAWEGFMKGPR